MQLIDDFGINLSLNEIKRSIKEIQNKVETISETKQYTNATLFKDDILKELYNIRKEIDKTPKGSSIEIDSLRYSINNIQHTLIDEVCPAISNQPSIIDLSFLFNDVKKNLNDITRKTCEIETKSSLDSIVINDISTRLTDISTELATVSANISNLANIPSPPSILISYPTSGTATITTGTTVFDFREGIVTYPDGTVDNMSGSSEIGTDIYIRSFTVFVDRPVDISISGITSNTISIPSGSFRLKEVEITRINITSIGDTNIWLSGSTSSDGAPNISFSFGESDSIGLPNAIIVGTKTNISTTASQITTTSTLINKVVTIKVRSLGTGTYIAIGTSSLQPFRLTSVSDSTDIDFIDNLDKIYIITDIGSTGEIEFIGG